VIFYTVLPEYLEKKIIYLVRKQYLLMPEAKENAYKVSLCSEEKKPNVLLENIVCLLVHFMCWYS